jgi:hypothetical protein
LFSWTHHLVEHRNFAPVASAVNAVAAALDGGVGLPDALAKTPPLILKLLPEGKHGCSQFLAGGKYGPFALVTSRGHAPETIAFDPVTLANHPGLCCHNINGRYFKIFKEHSSVVIPLTISANGVLTPWRPCDNHGSVWCIKIITPLICPTGRRPVE